MRKTAYFAGGCFWCIVPIFDEIEGVTSVVSGYCGGDEENPTYEQVKLQKTHHRETISVEYEPEKVSFRQLFKVFLDNVDPFDADGQFVDRGESYTLAVFCTDETERTAAEEMLQNLAEAEGKQPAVSIESYKTFWPAEEYHQDYYLKNPEAFEKEWNESGRIAVCPLRRKQVRNL